MSRRRLRAAVAAAGRGAAHRSLRQAQSLWPDESHFLGTSAAQGGVGAGREYCRAVGWVVGGMAAGQSCCRDGLAAATAWALPTGGQVAAPPMRWPAPAAPLTPAVLLAHARRLALAQRVAGAGVGVAVIAKVPARAAAAHGDSGRVRASGGLQGSCKTTTRRAGALGPAPVAQVSSSPQNGKLPPEHAALR
jgi:hypothetical protein